MKTFLALLLLISQISMAASQECDRQFESVLYRTSEASRLETSAIHKGFDIETGPSEATDVQTRHANKLWELSQKHYAAVESLKESFKLNCLK